MGAIFCQRIIVGCRQMSPNCPFWFFEPSSDEQMGPWKGGSLLKHYVQLRHCCVDKMVVTGFQMV